MKHPERGKEKLGSFEGTLPRFFLFESSVTLGRYTFLLPSPPEKGVEG